MGDVADLSRHFTLFSSAADSNSKGTAGVWRCARTQ